MLLDMDKTLINIFFLFSFACSVAGQSDVLLSPDVPIFYQGVKNILTLSGLKTADSLNISTDNGAIKFLGQNRIEYVPTRTGPSHMKIKLKGAGVTDKFYVVTTTPDPTPNIVHFETDYSDLDRIKQYKEFEPFIVTASYFSSGQTDQFRIIIVRNNSTILDHINIGGKFDTDILQTFGNLQHGDIITFSEWTIKAPEGLRTIHKTYRLTID